MKIIILCYDFPPLISIGGQRPLSWFKYLSRENISVTVITRHWKDNINTPIDYVKPTHDKISYEKDTPNNTIIRVPFAPNFRDRLLIKFGLERFVFFRKFLSLFYSVFEFLFFFFDARANIYYAADRQIRELKPDYIIATGEPFILFKYAHLLSSKYKIPWIADYRDGWTNNQGAYKRGWLTIVQNFFFQVIEKKYTGNAAFITTAAPIYAESLSKIHPKKDIKVIYNGFDEEYFTDIENINVRQEKFVITYAGTIYPHQRLDIFLQGLQKFISTENINPNNFEVQFYGIQAQSITLFSSLGYNLLQYVKVFPKIPYGEMIKKMRESHLLLLLTEKSAGWLNAKIFDYFGVKRKIILVENDHGILEKLLSETQSGFAADNADDVAAFLLTEYQRFQRKESFEIELTGNYLNYTRKKQAQILAGLLRSKI